MDLLRAVGFFVLYVIVGVGYKIFDSWIKRKRFLDGTKQIQGGEGTFFLGFIPDLLKRGIENRLDFFFEVCKRPDGTVGKCGRLKSNLMAAPGIMIAMDPVLVKHILKDRFDTWIKTDPVIKRNGVQLFREWMGDGIFVVDHGKHIADKGASWFAQRKTAATIFTLANFRDYMRDVFVERSGQLIARLERTDKTQPIEMQTLFFKVTMDSFARIGFGAKMDTVNEQEDAYASAFDKAHLCVVKYGQGEKAAPVGLINLLPFPLDKIGMKIYRAVDPLSCEFKEHCKTLNKYTKALIDERRKDLGDQADLLALFMQSQTQDGKALSDKYLTDVVMNFMIAGRDTTACTLSWMFYLLAKHPEIQERVIAEVDQHLQGEAPTFDGIKGMDYLHGFLYEALRLHPPVPLDLKVAAVDDELPDGSRVPAGTKIIFYVWGMGRHPDLWEDPMEVKPERWINRTEPVSDYAFPVFQAGPRICLGKTMAEFEAKTVTIMVLQKFRVALADPKFVPHPARLLTMCIEGGLPLMLTPRE